MQGSLADKKKGAKKKKNASVSVASSKSLKGPAIAFKCVLDWRPASSSSIQLAKSVEGTHVVAHSVDRCKELFALVPSHPHTIESG